MHGADAIVVIIFIIIFVVSGLKKLLESLAEQQQKHEGRARRPDFEATPSEVEEFLRSLQESRQQQAQVLARQRGVQVGPAQPAPGQVQAPQAAPFWQAEEGAEGAAAIPAVRPKRVRRRAEPRERAPEPPPRREPVRQAPPPSVAPKAATPPPVKGMDLKQAVIWSEILGRPLSLRPRRGHRPPGQKP